jgi:hypothetical protein
MVKSILPGAADLKVLTGADGGNGLVDYVTKV